jgi:hypothetical protein
VADVKRPRRYYLHKRLQARLYEGGDDSERVWQAKQEEQPGSALAETVPHRVELAALGYTTTEDLDGADVAELERAGLTQSQAKAVIAAL